MVRSGFSKFALVLCVIFFALSGCGGRREGTNTSLTRVLVEGIIRDAVGSLVDSARVLDLTTGDEVEVTNGSFSIDAARSEDLNVELLVSSFDREQMFTLQAHDINPKTQKFALEIRATNDGFETTKVEIVDKDYKSDTNNQSDPLVEDHESLGDQSDKESKKTPKMAPPLVMDEPSETPTPEQAPPPTEAATAGVDVVVLDPNGLPIPGFRVHATGEKNGASRDIQFTNEYGGAKLRAAIKLSRNTNNPGRAIVFNFLGELFSLPLSEDFDRNTQKISLTVTFNALAPVGRRFAFDYRTIARPKLSNYNESPISDIVEVPKFQNTPEADIVPETDSDTATQASEIVTTGTGTKAFGNLDSI